MLPSIAKLFHISIDKLFGNSYEIEAEKCVGADKAVDENTQQEINQKITAIVNREFEIGISEGRIPNAEELANKISEFFERKS